MVRKLGRFTLILGSILLVLGFGEPADVQGPEEGWQIYTDGNNVYDLALEGGGALGGGYTWAATMGGVVCYGDSEYVKFTTLDGLARNNVHAVVEDSGGRWWFAMWGGGVSMLDDGGTPLDKADDNWTTFTAAEDELASDVVLSIVEDSGGRLWFGTQDGVSVLDYGEDPFDKRDDTWITFTTADGLVHNWVVPIAEDGEGRMWFGTGESGVSVLDYGEDPFDKGDDKWATFTESDGLVYRWVHALAGDSEGRMWFGTYGGGTSVLDHGGTPFDKGDDTWITFTWADGLAYDRVLTIFKDSGGRWWFGTDGGGVSVLDHRGTPFDKMGDNWATFTTADGLADNHVRAIAEDDGGRMWFGTDGGVSVLDHGGTPFDKEDDTWTTFITADGLADNGVYAIAKDGEGWLWFGTWGGASVLDDGDTPFDEEDDTWATFTTDDGLLSNVVYAVFEDSRKRLWFGTWGGGASVLDHNGTPFYKGDDTWITYTSADGLASDAVYAIAEDGEGRFWFGAGPWTHEGGVSVLDDGGTPSNKGDDTWVTFTESDGLANNWVRAIAEDDEGWWWFGTDWGGVSALDHGDTPFYKGDDIWVTFTTVDGLAGNYIPAIVVDDGRLWFGTNDGVSVLDHGVTLSDKGDDTWASFTRADGLVDNSILSIAADGGGRLWFSTSWFGVSVLDDGSTPFYKGDDLWATFTMADGLADNGVYAIAVDGTGKRWFGTDLGVSVLVDRVAPSSRASSPEYADGTIPVSWSANDGGSGVLRASLWVKYGSDGTWMDTGMHQHAGRFYYAPAQGYGTYYFATVAEDWMGNVEATPTGDGDTCTVYDDDPPPDDYEPDDTCDQASSIPTDGTVQVHTFHDQGDTDWVTFDATSGTTCLIQVQVPAGSPADVVLELYDRCDGLPQDSQDHDFDPGVRMAFQAAAGGPLYLKLANHDPAVYGANVAYHLSVRALDDTPNPGALILVAGRLKMDDSLQDNIHHVTDAVRQLFLAHNYDDEHIYYLATGSGCPGRDGMPTAANLEAAITDWAIDKVGPDRPLTLYLADHGRYDRLYLDKTEDEWVSPQELDGWLTQLEAAVAGVEVHVIVEACHSGSFIDLPQTASEPGRAVIASTGAYRLAHASDVGAIFSDHFVAALGRGESLCAAFQSARWATEEAHPGQTPWVDDNGNGIHNEEGDCQGAGQWALVSAETFDEELWPPYIVQVVGPAEIEEGQGTIRAQVRDDEGVRRVWAVVYPPSYRPLQTEEELIQETLPTMVLLDQGGDWYGATYVGFDEVGLYRVVVYAEDEEGLQAQPVAIEVRTGWAVYLPLALR